jgi:hypothetical protein
MAHGWWVALFVSGGIGGVGDVVEDEICIEEMRHNVGCGGETIVEWDSNLFIVEVE